MKLKCADGLTRRFEIAYHDGDHLPDGTRASRSSEASCVHCGALFGVHSTNILKAVFRAHVCDYGLDDIRPPKYAGLLKDGIVATPDTMSGSPRIDGTRIRVTDVLRAIAEYGNVTLAYPYITKTQAGAALEFAAGAIELLEEGDGDD